MKSIALCLILLLAPLPAIAGHEKAPPQLGIPWAIGEYLHQFGDMRSTIIRICPETACRALVSFYDTEDDASWVGIGTFAVNDDGSLGRLLNFRFPDGHQWVYEGDGSPPKWSERHSIVQ